MICKRPILRGRDIKRYGYEFADKWLISTHNGTDKEPAVDINDYPDIKEHLDQYLPQITKRYDQGDTPYNLRSCAYWDDFSKHKIVWKVIGNQMAFSIDSDKYIVNNACYILTGPDLKYLLSVLNSNIIRWYSYITNMNKTGVGDVQVGRQNLNLFPIPLLPDIQQAPFIYLVKQLLINIENHKDTAIIDAKINNLIYEMYKLSEDEVHFIETLYT